MFPGCCGAVRRGEILMFSWTDEMRRIICETAQESGLGMSLLFWALKVSCSVDVEDGMEVVQLLCCLCVFDNGKYFVDREKGVWFGYKRDGW